MSGVVAAAAPETLLVRVVPPETPLGGIRWLRTMLRNPMETWPRALYESDFISSGKPGRRGVLLADPELVQRALVREADAFDRTAAMRRALSPSLGRGLLTSDGAHWRWQRRVTSPAFRHDRLGAFVPAMTRSAEATASRWAAAGEGGVIDLGHEMMRSTFDIIADTMLSGGKDLDVPRFEQAIATSLGTTNWRILYAMFRLPDWVPHPGRGAARAAELWMRDAAFRVVADRRAALAAGAAGAGDLLDLLLQAEDPEGDGGAMADENVVDNILTFIVAGHETTAGALTWAFYALSKHPGITARVLAEIASVVGDGPVERGHVDRLVYTRQVVQEALRLFPSAPVFSREVRRDVTVGPLELSRGDSVVIPVYVIHRHRKLWTDPDRFDPDRFAPEASAARHRYAFLPFGAGPRTCIGMNFALNESIVILASLLPRFRLELAPGTRPEFAVNVTLRPRTPMRMVVRHRAEARNPTG